MIFLCKIGIHAWDRRCAKRRPEREIRRCRVCGLTRVTKSKAAIKADKRKLAAEKKKAKAHKGAEHGHLGAKPSSRP